MVIRGRTRGNGKQLAQYLVSMKDNQAIHIMDVTGQEKANDNDLRQALYSMSLTSELTKSDKGLYHAQINPAYGEDKAMSPEAWFQAADILGKELGLDDQRRVIVLHTKNDRTHAHVVWERYDHEKKKMASDSYSRLAQDRARQEMEKVFEHTKTPERNPNRLELKKTLSDLWKRFTKGKDFIQAAQKAGYTIAAGLQRRPFMVVDKEGRSFDLVRQLEKVKTKEVRERLKDEKLVGEKDAIALIRQKQKLKTLKEREASNTVTANDNSKAKSTAVLFAENKSSIDKADIETDFDVRNKTIAGKFSLSKEEATRPEQQVPVDKKANLAEQFTANKDEQLSKQQDTERMRQQFIENMKRKPEKEKGPDRTLEPD